MSSNPDLRLDWCSHEAAKYAVEHWHYSRSLPTPPLVRIGVWEKGQYIGAVLFSRGSSCHLGRPYGLKTTEVCELTRVALDMHTTATTRIVSIALKMFRRTNPGICLVVSFADPNHGHHGGIFIAGGWIYVGQTSPTKEYIDKNGRRWHERQVSVSRINKQYGTYRRVPSPRDLKAIKLLGKHRYLMPFDNEIRQLVKRAQKEYPKRATSIAAMCPPFQAGEGGSTPTVALQYT